MVVCSNGFKLSFMQTKWQSPVFIVSQHVPFSDGIGCFSCLDVLV
jgi:hypothetical protein